MVPHRVIIHSEESPALNIALEEVLLASVLQSGQATLRLWENVKPAIYLGLGKSAAQEVHLERCQRDDLAVIRRFSGGGTVLHQAGVVNLAYALPLDLFPECQEIQDSYQFMFSLIKKILEPWAIDLSFHGLSDFCIGPLKVVGNAQARRRGILLHHATFLLSGDLNQIPYYLKEPTVQPEYREKRSHVDFVTTLEAQGYSVSLEDLAARILDLTAVSERSSFSKDEFEQARFLCETKYDLDAWNLKS